MKISKTALLALSWALSIAGLWLMFVSADKDLRINPRNAIQHIETVKFISWSTTATATLKQLGNNSLVGIETNNFVLSEDDSSNEIIEQNTVGASILWWWWNKIWETKKSNYSVILWWVGNTIDNWYSTILWWERNKIDWAESTILWWKDNGVAWGSSVIVWWHDNEVNGSKSVVVWSNSSVNWDLSVALWLKSRVSADNSFLWTDWTHRDDTLTANNVFAVVWGSGMVIGTNQAHSFAQLTLNGGLVIRKGGNNLECNSSNGWSLKVVDGPGGKICLCSCDGHDNIWNSMFGLGQCKSACDDKYIQPDCGEEVVKICIGNETVYSWSCKPWKWVVVEWTWAYFVDKKNIVHWSCQTDDGLVEQCAHAVTEDKGCRETDVQFYCKPGDRPNDSSQIYKFWNETYPVNYSNPAWHRVGDNVTELNACEWRCNVEGWYVWDSTANRCIFKTATLTYNANGCGTAPSPNQVTMTFTAETKAVGMTATNGRSFTKWCEHSNGSAPCYNSWDTVKAANVVPTAKTLYAQCTAEPTAILKYDANGCGTAPDSVTMAYSTETKAATSMKTINQGWTLNKWCTQNNGWWNCYDKWWLVKAANVSPTPLTLYAQCTAPCIRTIKYNANGWTPTPSEQSVTCGNSETLANAPTKQWYAFGWWKSSENSQIYEAWASYTPSASTVTMTAQWTDNENTLTVNPNWGKVTFDGVERTSSHSVTKRPGATITVPNASGKSKSVESAGRYSIKYEGAGWEPVPSIQYAARTKTTTYTFNKWNDSANCGIMNGTTYTFPSSNGTTCTKTAQWSSSEEYKTDSVTLGNEPIRQWYTFAWWKSSTDGQVYPAWSSYTPTADTTMTAQWTTCSYKITYKPNGWKFSDWSTNDKVVNVSCGQSTTLVSWLKKEWYTFTNWKLDGVSINAYYNEWKTYTPTKDVTFIAQWTDNENTLTVDPNWGKVIFDGAERTSSHSVTKKAGATITVPNASKSNSIESDGTYTVSYDTDGWTSQTPSNQKPAKLRKTTYTFNKWNNAGTACGGMNGTTYTFPPYDGTTCTKTANWTTNTTYSTESVTLADAPIKPNCEFQWWKSSTNNVIYDAWSSYTPTEDTMMTAQWSCACTNKLTVDPNGGSVKFGESTITTSTSKVGNCNSTTTLQVLGRASSSQNVASYKVEYDINGGASDTKPSAQNALISVNKSYSFDRWENSGNYGTLNGTTYKFLWTHGVEGTKKVIWKETSEQSIACVILANKPTKSNCTFDGWKSSTDNQLYQPWYCYKPTTNTTMTAQWSCTTTKTFKATFKANGNQIINPNNWQTTSNDVVVTCTTAWSSCSINSPSIVAPNATPSVIWWSTSSTNHTSQWDVGAGKSISSDVTYYAQTKNWDKEMKVNLYVWNWVSAIWADSKSCTIYTTYNGVAQWTSCSVKLPTCTVKDCYENCKFWTYEPEANYTIAGDNEELTATATMKKYSVMFKANGWRFADGTTNDKSYDVSCWGPIGLRGVTWSNHTFLGWYTAQNGWSDVWKSGNYRPTSDVTLRAHWEESHAGCVNYSSSNQCTDWITWTPITSTDPTKVMWTCWWNDGVICEKCADGLSYIDWVCKRNYPTLIIDSISDCQMKYHFVPYTPYTTGAPCCNPVRFEKSYDGNTWSYVTTSYDGDIPITSNWAQWMIYIRYTVDNWVTYSDTYSYNMSKQSCGSIGCTKQFYDGTPMNWELDWLYLPDWHKIMSISSWNCAYWMSNAVGDYCYDFGSSSCNYHTDCMVSNWTTNHCPYMSYYLPTTVSQNLFAALQSYYGTPQYSITLYTPWSDNTRCKFTMSTYWWNWTAFNWYLPSNAQTHVWNLCM